MCISHLRLWLIFKPRYLTRGTGERAISLNFKFFVLLDIPQIIRSSDFDPLNSIEFVFGQTSKSNCRMQGSIIRALLSSANKNTEEEMHNGKSLIKANKQKRAQNRSLRHTTGYQLPSRVTVFDFAH